MKSSDERKSCDISNFWTTQSKRHKSKPRSHKSILSPIKTANRYKVLNDSPCELSEGRDENSYLSQKGKRKCKIKTSSSCLKLMLWNAQSIKQKIPLLNDFIEEHNIDVSLLVETWLKSSDTVEIGELENNGENCMLNAPREERPGGGIGALFRSNLNAKKQHSMSTKTFENLETLFDINGRKITIVTVYRPEPTEKNKYALNDFYDEFTKFLTHYQSYNHEFILTGDFNFHINKPNDRKA